MYFKLTHICSFTNILSYFIHCQLIMKTRNFFTNNKPCVSAEQRTQNVSKHALCGVTQLTHLRLNVTEYKLTTERFPFWEKETGRVSRVYPVSFEKRSVTVGHPSLTKILLYSIHWQLVLKTFVEDIEPQICKTCRMWSCTITIFDVERHSISWEICHCWEKVNIWFYSEAFLTGCTLFYHIQHESTIWGAVHKIHWELQECMYPVCHPWYLQKNKQPSNQARDKLTYWAVVDS